MFNSNNEMNFSDENCYAWEEISGNKSGEIVEAETLITYENVLDIDDNSQFIISDKWIIVRLTDIGHLFSIPALINRIIIPQNITIFAIINLFSFLIAIALVNLKKKDSQLSLTEKLADSTSDAVVITDEYTNILYVNKAFEKATGYLSREVIGKKTNHFKSGKQDKEFYTDMWDSINSKGEWTGLLWDKKRDGLLYPKKLRIYSIFEPATKQVIYYVGMFNDLSSNHNEHQNSVEQQVKIKSHLIPNEELMFELFAQSLNNNEYNFLILYIDIENYNQLFEFVRQESKEIADMFMKLLYPLLSEEDFIAQTGRNLFTAIINIDNITKNIDEYIRELHNSLSSVIETGDQKFFYKTKIGASVSIDSLDAKTILFNAVIALEWALIQNIDYAIYSQDIVLQLNSEHEIESLLRTAIDEDELYMVYQPQIDIRSNKMVGMEALIRWENDKLGFVSPAVFIPLVEKNNLMIEIGDWIIEQVCKDIFKMKELNASIHELVCAINISGIQLLEIDFTKKLLDVMKKYNVDSNKIEIELTESILLTSEKKNINLLKMLRKKGLLIAIDDFGTGYSSISYLNDLPIDKIKIDRCFIQNYPEDDDGKLVKLLINMGHVLGIEILTEGAETSDQIELLRNHGCAYVQGYYYSKPLTMSEFVNYYNNY
jgi:PAS domain S-box-containing protein